MSDTVTPDRLPAGVLDHQYTRCALYLSHIAFYEALVAPRLGEGLKAIEFGGSNGFIAELFVGVSHEVAANAPVVDIHDLSAYESDTYDFVVLDEILEHVARPWIAVEEVRRILKPGGTLITSSPFMIAVHKVPEDYWRFTKDAMRILLERYTTVETHSWGNPASVAYLMNGMMVTTREAIEAGVFDLTNVEKYAIDVWTYATKQPSALEPIIGVEDEGHRVPFEVTDVHAARGADLCHRRARVVDVPREREGRPTLFDEFEQPRSVHLAAPGGGVEPHGCDIRRDMRAEHIERAEPTNRSLELLESPIERSPRGSRRKSPHRATADEAQSESVDLDDLTVKRPQELRCHRLPDVVDIDVPEQQQRARRHHGRDAHVAFCDHIFKRRSWIVQGRPEFPVVRVVAVEVA